MAGHEAVCGAGARKLPLQVVEASLALNPNEELFPRKEGITRGSCSTVVHIPICT